MKTYAKTLVLLGIILTGSSGLAGQKSLLLQDIKPLMALTSDTRYDVELSAVYGTGHYQFYLEEKLQLKDWMINMNRWNAENTRLTQAIRSQKEEAISLEGWMTQPFSIDRKRLNELVKADKEIPLKLESWMICCADWKIARL